MIKPKGKYLILTPAGNVKINLIDTSAESPKYTMQYLEGKDILRLFESLTAMEVKIMKLYEVKAELCMEPVTSINVTSMEPPAVKGRKK